MMEPPTTEWRAEAWPQDEALEAAPVSAAWRALAAPVTHTFTHFHLSLDIYTAEMSARTAAPTPCVWVARADLAGAALPSVMRKVLAAALD
jgi:A/G-specific adenine glycosylase